MIRDRFVTPFLLALSLLSANAFAENEHGVGNGGDPRELYLHRVLMTAKEFAGTGDGQAALGLPGLGDGIELKIRVREKEAECLSVRVVEGQSIAVVRLGADCFDRIGADPRLALATMANFALSLAKIEALDPSGERFGPYSRRLLSVDAGKLLRTRGMIEHPTCVTDLAPELKASAAANDAIREALRSRGYGSDREGAPKAADRLSLGLLDGKPAIVVSTAKGPRALLFHPGESQEYRANPELDSVRVRSSRDISALVVELSRLPRCIVD